MCEKRFVLKKCKLYDVVYNKDVAIATFKNVDDADVICSWLNELYDQNVQLLIQKTQLQEKNVQLGETLRLVDEQQDTISQLEEENDKTIQKNCIPCELVNLQTREIDKLKEENEKLRNIHLSIDLTYSYGYGRYIADVRVVDV